MIKPGACKNTHNTLKYNRYWFLFLFYFAVYIAVWKKMKNKIILECLGDFFLFFFWECDSSFWGKTAKPTQNLFFQ